MVSFATGIRALLLAQVDDVFVRMGDVEVAPEQFGRKVGIDLLGIEQDNEIFEPLVLVLERCDLRLALSQQRKARTPGEHAIGAGKGESTQRR